MNRENNRRAEETEDILADALLPLLKQAPLEEITITQVCQYGQLTRKAFYNHFRTKEQLLEWALARECRRMVQYYNSIPNLHMVPAVSEESVEYSYVRYFEYWNRPEQREFLNMLYERKLFPLFTVIYGKNGKTVNVKEVLALERFTPVVAEYFPELLASTMLTMLIQWTERGFRESPKELCGILMQIIDIFSLYKEKEFIAAYLQK